MSGRNGSYLRRTHISRPRNDVNFAAVPRGTGVAMEELTCFSFACERFDSALPVLSRFVSFRIERAIEVDLPSTSVARPPFSVILGAQ